jgi:hypothetical protein
MLAAFVGEQVTDLDHLPSAEVKACRADVCLRIGPSGWVEEKQYRSGL